MKLIALASSAAVAAASIDIDDGSIESVSRFAAWNKLHGKSFTVGSPEHLGWLSNDAIIQASNAKGLSYTLGHNEYSYLAREDFAARLTMSMPKSYMRKNMDKVNWDLAKPENIAAAADSVDWTTKGAVTPIKNQAQCGSCWAFSTTGSIEGAFQIAGNPLTSFSEQELVSCDKVDNGCQGGLMDNGFTYAETHALCTEESYPYTSGTGIRGTCKTSCTGVVEVTKFADVPARNEDALKTAVSKQPVSVAIEADKSVFQLYKSGVMDSKACGTKLDHGVLAVGYGTDENGKDYWKVKNSWGETWGDNGYIRLGRGDNTCGISQQPSYPSGVKKAGPPGPTPPGPSPTPGPTPPSGTHYEDPNTTGSCMSDEVDIQINGITGSICSPKCTGIFKTKCPKDVPAGVTAEPECALNDAASNEKYCALICSPSTDEASLRAGDAQCSAKGSCKAVPNAPVGICTYDS